jgi:YD repeat-containing protein
MSGKFYALKLSILILISLAFGFALSYLWTTNQARSAEQRTPAIPALGSDKERDGLLGSVRQTRVETAKLLNKSGKLVEGPRQLMEMATYDQQGNLLESAHYLVSIRPYSGRQEFEYDDKGNITGMTVRDANNSIVGKEAYRYEFDAVGNWTKMTTTATTEEANDESRRPDEITYRSITYYFDKNIASVVDENPVGNAESESVSETSAEGEDADRPKSGLTETFNLLRRGLDEWIKANNARDIDKEISFYGQRLLFYYRARNVSRDFVQRDKSRMFDRAELIDVRAGAPEITLDRDGKVATMRFRKQYIVKMNGSQRYGEVLQEMRWQLTDDGWRIIGERDAQVIR